MTVNAHALTKSCTSPSRTGFPEVSESTAKSSTGRINASKCESHESSADEISASLSKEDIMERITALAVGRMKYGSRAEGEIFEEAIFQHDEPLTPTARFRLAVRKVKKIVGERCCLTDRKLNSDANMLVMMVRHWLEATDRDHRNGSNLLHYYNVWLDSSTTDDFFIWLDEGEGKLLNLPDCDRFQLETQHVKYLTIIEREQYEVAPRGGKLCYVQSGELVDGVKIIFVMGINGALYMAQKERGRFHHSSFFGGAAVMVAGSASVTQGLFTKLTPHSGHYRPVSEDFVALIQRLEAQHFNPENLVWVKHCVDDVEFGDKTKGK